MSILATLLPVLLALLMAIGQIRENRRRGLAINWPKTLVTFLGVVAITGLAFAGLLWRVSLDAMPSGVLLFAIVLLTGIVALSIGVNRRWPRAGDPHP